MGTWVRVWVLVDRARTCGFKHVGAGSGCGHGFQGVGSGCGHGFQGPGPDLWAQGNKQRADTLVWACGCGFGHVGWARTRTRGHRGAKVLEFRVRIRFKKSKESSTH